MGTFHIDFTPFTRGYAVNVFPGPSGEHEDKLKRNVAHTCDTSESIAKAVANRSGLTSENQENEIH